MYNLTFLPFVGKNYNNGGMFGKRIMVLGDNHYGSVPQPNITRDVLGWYLDQNVEREGWMNTFLKFERSLVNRETTPKDSLEIWNSLLFYNYLQVLLDGPREAGTEQQYKDSAGAFFQVMDRYRPDDIIVWGKRLWKNLPWDNWIEGAPVTVDGVEIDNGYYKLNDGQMVRVVCVYHPSVGYSWDYWHKVIMRFM